MSSPVLHDALLRTHELRQWQAAQVRQALALGHSLVPVAPAMALKTRSVPVTREK